jgi:hypothetical protein
MEDEEKDVSSHCMTLRKREDAGNLSRKHYLALLAELVEGETTD